jgi:hypothetical protein
MVYCGRSARRPRLHIATRRTPTGFAPWRVRSVAG